MTGLASRASAEGAIIDVLRASWDPGWYNLDQSLAAGRRDAFLFSPATPPDPYDLRFHNSLAHGDEEWRDATVVAIRHPVLGEVTRVDTHAFGEYTFGLAGGGSVVVEAEENPPYVNRQTPAGIADGVREWALEVVLADVSAPRSTHRAESDG